MQKWRKNRRKVKMNGQDVLCNECPRIECGDFDNYPVIYVDKKATGAGHGSSWTDAYTDIQTAVNAHPRAEIQIKGYGESDCYPAGISLPECAYLHGMDTGSGAVWIDGENSNIIGISGGGIDGTTKIDSINIKGCKNSCFAYCPLIINCSIKDTTLNGSGNQSGGFWNCNILDNCSANNILHNNSFTNCRTLNGCTSENSFFGFWNGVSFGAFILTGCTATNHSFASFTGRQGSVFNTCIAEYQQSIIPSFSAVDCVLIDCIARNNQGCGYKYYTTPNSYINCIDSNNCLAWGGDCSGQGCDSV